MDSPSHVCQPFFSPLLDALLHTFSPQLLSSPHLSFHIALSSLTYPAKTDTTRPPRANEQNGKDYTFTSKEAFLTLVHEGGFIEHAVFGGNHYGTSVRAVRDVSERGRVCVLDIEMEVRGSPPLSSPRPSPPSLE